MPDQGTPDMVNHPPHYKTSPSGIECIRITRGCVGDLANSIKYVYRAWDKGSLQQDIDKSRWYLRDFMRHENAQSFTMTSESRALLRVVAQAETPHSNPRKFYLALADGKWGDALDVLDDMLTDIASDAADTAWTHSTDNEVR